ncbi:MAG: acyl-CoA dehydrogenase [Hyphomicrobiaceae bacterium]|nr:acyl-CoA dehydrogenase [Hyphomicrobiaceae bacterium]
MSALMFIVVCFAAIVFLALRQAPLSIWAAVVAVLSLVAQYGVPFFEPVVSFSSGAWIGWVLALLLGVLAVPDVRRRIVVEPAYNALKKIMPRVSETEQEALEAGTIGWDAELFSGAPDWARLGDVSPPTLSAEEREFLEGPTEELCAMLDDWDIRHNRGDIPKDVWKFVSDKGFLGMLISKEHGGLGFSAQAQSLIIGKIASRCPDVAVIVMVPNSLGPGELIERYGTDEQKTKYLKPLAKGKEIPCFGLTGPTSGSDAATMRDIGVVCKRKVGGKETLGLKINWEKRYISLGPNATLLGLAFIAIDPDGLLGGEEELGITVALIPTDHKGVEIGRRHLPGGVAFPNGPNWGKDVFVPLDWVVGGREGIGQGWRMLMECLSEGRAISLPASSTAAAKSALRTTSAYARIRKQFGLPIGFMEGIEEPLARMVETAYVNEAGRSVTASMVSAGEKPSVISAILKYQTTERMRSAINDAFDIHGGRAICDGPSNYLQTAYQAVPVAITVEGANILTRTLITFAQGALRSHPWLYKEIQALRDPDAEQGIEDFEEAFNGHAAYMVANVFGALFHNLTGGYLASAPAQARATRRWYRQLARSARTFALVSDVTVVGLGGGLKTKQKITGRLADALSELYLLSCVLKRFEDDGQPSADRQIVDFCAANCLYRFQQAIKGVLDNFPVAPVRYLVYPLAFPLGARRRPASDRLGKAVSRAVLKPGEVRDRLTRDIFITDDPADLQGVLEHTLAKVEAAQEADKKVDRAVRAGTIRRTHANDWIADAKKEGVVTGDEAKALKELESLVARVIAVDHFDPAEVIPHYKSPENKSLAAE